MADLIDVQTGAGEWVRTTIRNPRYVPGYDPPIYLLSRPTKMPGPSWSLPAGRPGSCPFMVLGDGSICGSCYAGQNHRGRYRQAEIQRAQWARFDWARESLRTKGGTDFFVEFMTEAIADAGHRFMRVHDSGDLFSAAYTRAWTRICADIPEMRFWFPTRSWRAPWLDVIVELASLRNVTVRPSALFFDDPPPVVPGLAAGTTATEVGFSCPAPRQGNACMDCRRCWIAKRTPVSYHAH